MSEITIREIKSSEFCQWDEIIDSSPQGSINHRLDWLRIVETNSSSKLHLVFCYLGDEIIAAVPLFFQRKNFTNIMSSPGLNSMVQYLGPVFPKYDELKQDKREYYYSEFCKKLNNYIIDRQIDIVNIITSPNLVDVRPFIWNKYIVIPKYNYIKNIEDLDEVWGSFKKQLRKNIKNCIKNGFEIYDGDFEDYKFILKSVSNRLDKQDVDILTSEQYLIDIYNKFYPDNLQIFMVRFNGNPLTGVVTTLYKDKISIWVGATQTSNRGLYPVDFIQWEIIKWANKNGYKYCEIQGANMPSISFFKSRYNFELDIHFLLKKYSLKGQVLSHLITPKHQLVKIFKRT